MGGSIVHCAACGWPLAGARCAVCGGDGVPPPLLDATRRREPRETLDAVGLEASDAWRRQDYSRLIGISLQLAGGQGTRSTTLARGPAWASGIEGATVFVSLDPARAILAIEAPVARLPQRQRVPALRTALELSDGDGPWRVSLRGDRLLLRAVVRLAAMTPVALVHVLRETAAGAVQVGALLEAKFDARPAVDDSRVPAEWDALGQPVELSGVHPPPIGSMPPMSLAPEDVIEEIPAILAPALAASAQAVASGVPAIPRPAPVPSAGRPRHATLHEIQVDAASAAAPARQSVPPPAPTVVTPADQMCELLRQAQTLATALSYEDNPATTLLLIRATVYRAVYESCEQTSGAVSHLFHATHGVLREVWSSRAPKRRPQSSMNIPIAEPAFLAMEHIVAKRAAVVERRALTIDPLTSARDVKDHMAKIRDELDLAPAEAALRHFLALGALCELLVRTKLPAATEKRLREIVDHARRAGPKPSSVELLDKTIERIMAA